MRKLPVFVLAAATALTVAGVPMTAQAATCPTSAGNCFNFSNCFEQSGDINSILSRLGCSSGTTCTNGYTGTKGASCSKTKGAATNSGRQCRYSYRSCR